MCGRFELRLKAKELAKRYRLFALRPQDMPFSEEMAAGDPVLMLAGRWDALIPRKVRWGLVGHFLAAMPTQPPLTLAGEGLVERPFYSKILQRNRCLIPATAFFGMETLGHEGRQKIRYSDAKGRPLLFAGIYDEHPIAGSTCAIVTVAGQERMPLMLDRDACSIWLAEYDEFPGDVFEALIEHGGAGELRRERVAEPEVSPQLSFAFA